MRVIFSVFALGVLVCSGLKFWNGFGGLLLGRCETVGIVAVVVVVGLCFFEGVEHETRFWRKEKE